MENQPPAKPRKEEAAAGSIMEEEEEDRISQLPQHILQNHILSLLPQNVAVGTCILSKPWRHLGVTRPNFEFEEHNFPGTNQEFLSVVEKTLQRYDDQKLSIQEFVLGMSELYDSEPKNSFPLLHKWIPIVLTNKGLKTFNLSARYFSLPLNIVFQSELLEELFLRECNLLDQKNFNSTGKVRALSRLRTLSLGRVRIEEETFEKIMSICPLIEHLVLYNCLGLRKIEVKTAPNLKHLACHVFCERENGSIEIIDAPSLETISIYDCWNWYLNKNNYFFRGLKSLYLFNVRVPTELSNNLSSSNCPCLKVLQLQHCSGFTEFKLSNRSIERLILVEPGRAIKDAKIDAANMLHFEYNAVCPPSISFETTLRAECKSCICVERYSDNEFLKAFSQSQITLETSYFPELTNQDMTFEPVVVDHLCLKLCGPCPEIPALLNRAFRIFRPRYIGIPLHGNSQKIYAGPIWKALVEKGETKFWQQDLEESSIQLSDKNTDEEWRSVQISEFSIKENIRFRLKWRDLS